MLKKFRLALLGMLLVFIYLLLPINSYSRQANLAVIDVNNLSPGVSTWLEIGINSTLIDDFKIVDNLHTFSFEEIQDVETAMYTQIGKVEGNEYALGYELGADFVLYGTFKSDVKAVELEFFLLWIDKSKKRVDEKVLKRDHLIKIGKFSGELEKIFTILDKVVFKVIDEINSNAGKIDVSSDQDFDETAKDVSPNISLSSKAKEVIERIPTNNMALFQIYCESMNNYNSGYYGEAISGLMTIINDFPDYRQSTLLMGLTQKDINGYLQAIEYFETVTRLGKGDDYLDFQAYLFKGEYYELSFRFEESYENYFKASNITNDRLEKGRLYDKIANICIRKDDYQEALDFCNKALEYDYIRRERAEIYNKMGAIYWRLNDYRKAQEYIEKSIPLRYFKYKKKSPIDPEYDSKGLGVSENNLGVVFYNSGLYDRSLEKLMHASEIQVDVRERLVVLNNIGAVNDIRGYYDRAIEYYKKALALNPDDNHKAVIYNNIGGIYYNKSQYNKALDSYNMALKLGERTQNIKTIAIVLNNIGLVNEELGKYIVALKYYNMSLRRRSKLYDKQGLASTYNNIAEVYRNKGDYDKAKEIYKKVLKIDEELGDLRGKAITKNNIALMQRSLGYYDEALETLKEAVRLAEKIQDKPNIAIFNNNIGLTLFSKQIYDDALNYINKALKISEELGDKANIARFYNNLGLIYKTKNNFQQALKFYEKALKIGLEIGNLEGIAKRYNNIGKLFDSMGDFDKAIVNYEKALEIFEELGDKPSIAVICYNIASLYEKLGEIEKAIGYMRRTVRIEKEIRSPYIEADKKYLKKLERTLNEY